MRRDTKNKRNAGDKKEQNPENEKLQENSDAGSPRPVNNITNRIIRFRQLEKGVLKLTWNVIPYQGHSASLPVLTLDATQVYVTLDSDDRQDYGILKDSPIFSLQDNARTYRQRMDQFKKKSEDTWSTCGRGYLNLTLKWSREYVS